MKTAKNWTTKNLTKIKEEDNHVTSTDKVRRKDKNKRK